MIVGDPRSRLLSCRRVGRSPKDNPQKFMSTINTVKPALRIIAVLCVLPMVTIASVVWNIPHYGRA